MQAPFRSLLLAATLASFGLAAQVPDSLVPDGIPEIPAAIRADVGRYLEFRAAAFQGWHPQRREALITTRFADTTQLHLVRTPGGARRQLTFLGEPVAGAKYRPVTGDCIVFSQDKGGGEFFQLYRYDPVDARVTLLTDGQSRNTNVRWARSGRWLAYSSTRRNGKDTDIYLMDPRTPSTDRLVLRVVGGGWSVLDWSEDETRLLLLEYVSINESRLHIVDIDTGDVHHLTPSTGGPAAYARAQFNRANDAVIATSDRGADFLRLIRIDLATLTEHDLGPRIPWDVEDFELSPDGRWLAVVSNENGASRVRLLDARSGRERPGPALPLGVVSGLEWRSDSREIGFTFTSARSPSDVYSYDIKSRRLERWTESETGGLDPATFAEPEAVKVASFDGLEISAFVYRPDARRFPGARPVLIQIHGGPESQSRPGFQARNNYYVNELGIAVIYPNVRGSAGYGKRFLTLDNGVKREDSVKDIGALLDWITRQPGLDAGRVMVAGGSYGGYMVLATLMHYSDRLRGGVDVVGISNFVTFLTNTQDYRRDLRRAEYGDERDANTRAVLEQISPANHADRIRRPLMIVQGQNDPRVPVTESEQMVRAIRQHGGTVWYLKAKDEGHGFAKKRNQDFQFLATILFLKEHLLR